MFLIIFSFLQNGVYVVFVHAKKQMHRFCHHLLQLFIFFLEIDFKIGFLDFNCG